MKQQGKKLLVVDDEDPIRESLVLGLGDYGWDVTEACNCNSALEFDTPFDAYLIDLSLPDRDGFELAQTISKRFGEVPIVLLTGYLTDELKEEAPRRKVSAVVRKPFKFDHLDKVLQNLTETKKAN